MKISYNVRSKVKRHSSLWGNPPQSYGTPSAVWDQCYLLADTGERAPPNTMPEKLVLD